MSYNRPMFYKYAAVCYIGLISKSVIVFRLLYLLNTVKIMYILI